MGKKCIPGLFCIGNMTLFLVCLLFLCTFYLFLRISDLGKKVNTDTKSQSNLPPIVMQVPLPPSPPINTLTNLNAPPLRNNDGYDRNYNQIGILIRNNGSSEILPLMGRRKRTSRDKWQYYTMSGNNLQMKLPISVNGKSCTGEYGCDEIFNNDTVYVEGFKDIFVATIYENNMFSYNP